MKTAILLGWGRYGNKTMGKHFKTESFFRNHDDIKKKQDAKKSLGHYISQLKIHFDLNNKDVIEIIEYVYKKNKNTISNKKWWHIWK